ncbi:MAG: hypothetical protein ACI87E_005217, partial [Mariniblastus sp.]
MLLMREAAGKAVLIVHIRSSVNNLLPTTIPISIEWNEGATCQTDQSFYSTT